MPKENINTSDSVASRVEVTWESGKEVRIATTMHRDDRQELLGFEWDGYCSTLDRTGINRLIRALRRARDAAYGADA